MLSNWQTVFVCSDLTSNAPKPGLHVPLQWDDKDRNVVQSCAVKGGLLERFRYELRLSWCPHLPCPAAVLTCHYTRLRGAWCAAGQLLLCRRCRRMRCWCCSWIVNGTERNGCRLLRRLERWRPAICQCRSCRAHLSRAELLQQAVRRQDQKLVTCTISRLAWVRRHEAESKHMSQGELRS